MRDVYVNINGRIEYELVPGQDYPRVAQANLLSLAVSSLEADGIACTNVGITPITTPGANGVPSVTEVRHGSKLRHEGKRSSWCKYSRLALTDHAHTPRAIIHTVHRRRAQGHLRPAGHDRGLNASTTGAGGRAG